TWNYQEGQQVRVVCYTNAQSARLLLNGNQTGGEPKRDEKTNILYWDIPYAAGTLRCEADNGAGYEIKTNGQVDALKVTTDNDGHIFIEAIDKEGNRVRQADNMVTLYVQGARLLGMENGNIADTQVAGRQGKNRLRLHQGRLVAYIQPMAGEPLSLWVSSPLLKTVEKKF
ncbi:MAG: DUF4982 domain-containing protein, partial [Prevotella sp.]|nr:DUF4982 domain-containing protein [Prevotella sp.]